MWCDSATGLFLESVYHSPPDYILLNFKEFYSYLPLDLLINTFYSDFPTKLFFFLDLIFHHHDNAGKSVQKINLFGMVIYIFHLINFPCNELNSFALYFLS